MSSAGRRHVVVLAYRGITMRLGRWLPGATGPDMPILACPRGRQAISAADILCNNIWRLRRAFLAATCSLSHTLAGEAGPGRDRAWKYCAGQTHQADSLQEPPGLLVCSTGSRQYAGDYVSSGSCPGTFRTSLRKSMPVGEVRPGWHNASSLAVNAARDRVNYRHRRYPRSGRSTNRGSSSCAVAAAGSPRADGTLRSPCHLEHLRYSTQQAEADHEVSPCPGTIQLELPIRDSQRFPLDEHGLPVSGGFRNTAMRRTAAANTTSGGERRIAGCECRRNSCVKENFSALTAERSARSPRCQPGTLATHDIAVSRMIKHRPDKPDVDVFRALPAPA